MKNFFQKLPEQVVRLFIVFLVLVGGFIFVRAILPPAIKDSATHVRSTVERETGREIRFAGSAACAECHEEYTLKSTGYHKNLSCETCHGPAKAHAENPSDVKPALPSKREFCAHCHTYDPSRPTGFPQINPVAHNPQKPCIGCHNPHDPKPPTTPEECQACHAEIARTKAVSPHVLLECTTCHAVPEQHKVAPRMVEASIPSDRDFCGKCHSAQAKVKGPPKVDMSTHGEKYLCWECHYPHMPEVR